MVMTPEEWTARPRRIVGLMSGTSLDGVDAALIEVEGGIPPTKWRQLAFYTRPYNDEERARLLALMSPRLQLAELVRANVWLGEIFADAAQSVIAAAGMTPAEIDAVASHGQTIWHEPPHDARQGATLQLGEPAVIAERTGVLTVANFRPRDMAAGGQGAPLVPFADYLLFRSDTQTVAVQNIGGIANVTYLPRGARSTGVIAFDTGPGNMIIDALVAHYTDGRQTYDRDGAMAAAGHVHPELLAQLLAHPYLPQPPPKSTGRELFGQAFSAQIPELARSCNLRPEDVVATVTDFTAASIADAYTRFLFPHGVPDVVIIGGGGSLNPTLLAMLARRLPGVRVCVHEDFGISSEAKEAIAFALLGHATLCGVPSNLPSVTGAAHPVILGTITPGKTTIL